jgi:N-acetylglucosamine-6-phosphate deacetylase
MGFHVDPVVLRIALRGRGRPMLVTDAMPPVGGCRSNFYLYGREIRLLDGRCLRADGTLAGAALDMATAVRNCGNLLQVPLEDALRFASSKPRGIYWARGRARQTLPRAPRRHGGNRSRQSHRLGNLGGGRNGGGFPQFVRR